MPQPPPPTRVLLSVRRGVAWIELDGKATRNALDAESAAELVRRCDDVDSDPAVGAAVITGRHGAFCSGAARHVLAELADARADEVYEELGRLYSGFDRLRRLSVPTVARISGAAVGAGLNLALVADLRIAAESAVFISGFAANRIHPGGGHLHLLAQAGGLQTAAALGLFGQTVRALDALAAGVIWKVVPEDQLDSTVDDVTASAAADPELARAVKATFDRTAARLGPWESAVEVERARQVWSLTRPRFTKP